MELFDFSLSFLQASFVAILVCIVANIILGMVWYGPLFGKTWAACHNIKMDKKPGMKEMAEPMATSILGSAVQAAVLAGVFTFTVPVTLFEAKMTASALWLGFIATTVLNNYAWSMQPVALRMIDIFYALVAINVFATIIFYLG